MKSIRMICLTAGMVLSSHLLHAQTAGSYAVVERGANYRVLQKTTYEGGTNRVCRYTEIATGLYFTNSNGQLMESKEEIETYPRGAIARQGPYQVIFANNLNSAGAIDVQTPDGKRLRSNILGLAYNDDSTGQSVLFAQIQNSQGELISSNQVLYPDAFKGVQADVRYTYRKGSFEQDVILREQPPTPESFGLNPQTTEIEVLTEFINPPQAKVAEHKMKGRLNNNSLPDDDVDWGVTRIGHGRAFDLGESRNSHSRATVRRQYVTVQGRNILVEGVPVQKIKSSLANLPSQASSGNKMPILASKTLALPKTPLAQAEPQPMKLASASPSNEGFVLDYMELNTDQSAFTFQAGTTYLISGPVNLGDGSENQSSVIFQGGAVIKFTADASSGINYDPGDASYQGSPAHPVIFTSVDDNRVGQSIGTGDPTTLTNVIYLNNVENSGSVPNYLYFYYAGTAMNATDPTIIYNCRFFNCYQAILMWAGEVDIYNCLFSQCSTAINYTEPGGWIGDNGYWQEDDGISYMSTLQNVTADQIGQFVELPWSSGFDDGQVILSVANCIFARIDYLGNFIFYADNGRNENTAYPPSTSLPFVSGGNANYYLAANSIYHNAGTPVLGELTTMTTYAPQDGSWPDTTATDIGYHYPTNEDSDLDGLPDWWEWKWFGGYGETGSTLDSNGNTLLYDYTNGIDPVNIQFWMEPRSSYANTPQLSFPLNVTAGIPCYQAVLVDSTNFASATWTAYTSSNITVNLGTTDGWHRVWIGLHGQRPDGKQTWVSQEFKLDTVPPVVAVVNPAAITPSGVTVVKPYLQLQGSGNEQLGLITYDITNAAGVITNQQGSVMGQFYDTNCLDFTTNNFQCYDVPLTNGLNLITLHVSDLAGNMTTTNIAVTLDYSLATDPPAVTLIWPQDGMAVSGTNITIRGTTSDETGTVVAQVVNGDGTTTTVNGLVERNGMFWLENVPLNGTNQISIQATDASGKNTTTMDTITLLPSDVVLTIDSTPTGDDLYQSSGSVSGTVSDGDYDVWINGIEVPEENYSFNETTSTWDWWADNVPIYGMGTATFDAVAYPPEQQAQAMARAMDSGSPAPPPVNADTEVEEGPFVELVEYHENMAYYQPPPEGQTDHSYNGSYKWDYVVNYSGNQRTCTETFHLISIVDGEIEFDGDVEQDSLPPDQDLSYAWHNINGDSDWDVTHSFGRDVHYIYPSGGTIDLDGTTTRWVLHTGGKAKSGQMNLFCISIPSYNPKYEQPPQCDWGQTPEEKMDLTTIGVLAHNFGSDGKYWTMLADNQNVPAGITVATDHAGMGGPGVGTGQLQALNVVSGATQIDATNWAAVKTNDYVILEATLSTDDTRAAKFIQWSGGEAVTGNPFQRQVSKAASAETTVTATLGTNSFTKNVWIIWSTISILTSGTNPPNAPNHPPFGNDDTQILGVRYADSSSNAANGRMTAVATITPPGIHTLITFGLDFVQKRMSHDFIDGTRSAKYYDTIWQPDRPEDKYKTVVPDNNDKLYSVDGPGITQNESSTAQAVVSHETYNIFYDYITWESQVCCDTNDFWHFQGRWNINQTPQVTSADVSTGTIALPTNPEYPPP